MMQTAWQIPGCWLHNEFTWSVHCVSRSRLDRPCQHNRRPMNQKTYVIWRCMPHSSRILNRPGWIRLWGNIQDQICKNSQISLFWYTLFRSSLRKSIGMFSIWINIGCLNRKRLCYNKNSHSETLRLWQLQYADKSVAKISIMHINLYAYILNLRIFHRWIVYRGNPDIPI